MKLLSRYRTTPSAPKAKEAIERIDAAVRAARGVPAKTTKGNSDEDAATALVKLARSYYGSGLVEKAKAKLTECISKYPKTKAATEAGKLLKQWGPSGG